MHRQGAGQPVRTLSAAATKTHRLRILARHTLQARSRGSHPKRSILRHAMTCQTVTHMGRSIFDMAQLETTELSRAADIPCTCYFAVTTNVWCGEFASPPRAAKEWQEWAVSDTQRRLQRATPASTPQVNLEPGSDLSVATFFHQNLLPYDQMIQGPADSMDCHKSDLAILKSSANDKLREESHETYCRFLNHKAGTP